MADTRIDELRRRLERDPGSRLFAQLAEELRKSGELAEAIRVARAGLAVHAAYPSARLTLGRALLDSGDATGARAELDSAARDAPDNIQASRYLALAREQLGDLKGAAEQYRKTLLMAPDDRPLQAALAAVEARLQAPGGESAARAAQTTPPATKHAPPPLPAGAANAPAAPAAAPPVVFAPSRPTAPAAPEADAGVEGGALPPTLRIHASQADPPPQPAPARPSAPAPPPPPGASEAVEPKTLPGASRTEAPVERAGKPPSRPVAAQEAEEAKPAPAADGPSASTTPFSSSTLAELYFQQGLVDRAVDVYRQLVEQEPDNEKARHRLSELEHAAPAADNRAARRHALERTIAGLETLLGAVRRR